jgi:hypothetical protein
LAFTIDGNALNGNESAASEAWTELKMWIVPDAGLGNSRMYLARGITGAPL